MKIKDFASSDLPFLVVRGDCRPLFRKIPDYSIDAVVCDPPYPEIDRKYGRWTEEEWFELMDDVVTQCRRVLTPKGSAAFVLQPNSEYVGRMRPWLFEFMAKWAKEWNLIQDIWWWNTSALPTVHTIRERGLLRPSVKAVVWLGPPDCYRDQSAVLLQSSNMASVSMKKEDKLRYGPSGAHCRSGRMKKAAADRGGSTPMNLLPISNSSTGDSAGEHGHGAGTPMPLARWLVKYLCPPNGLVLDCFAGSGTIPKAAVREGRRALAFEKEAGYADVIRKRLGSTKPVGVKAGEGIMSWIKERK
jgi:DNA modification methylase